MFLTLRRVVDVRAHKIWENKHQIKIGDFFVVGFFTTTSQCGGAKKKNGREMLSAPCTG
jgi:hypothetical protein